MSKRAAEEIECPRGKNTPYYWGPRKPISDPEQLDYEIARWLESFDRHDKKPPSKNPEQFDRRTRTMEGDFAFAKHLILVEGSICGFGGAVLPESVEIEVRVKAHTGTKRRDLDQRKPENVMFAKIKDFLGPEEDQDAIAALERQLTRLMRDPEKEDEREKLERELSRKKSANAVCKALGL